MKIVIAAAVVVIAARAVWSAEPSLDQQLVVACYNVQIYDVVRCLRQGAHVNAKFGSPVDGVDPFFDRWRGSSHLGAGSWTPLIALASASQFPPPPLELGKIWKDEERATALRDKIPKAQIEQRRIDSMAILCVLLSHRCSLDSDDGFGSTALSRAVDNDKVEMARMLLRFGADPNTKSRAYIDGPSDVTPLHEASGSQELVQLLLDYGADPTAKDSEGRTPADWVAFQGDDRTFDLVLTSDGWRVRERNNRLKPPDKQSK